MTEPTSSARRGPRSLSSLPDTRLTAGTRLVNGLLVGIPFAGAIVLYIWVRHSGPLWALIPMFGLTGFAIWIGGRRSKHSFLAQVQRDTAEADDLLERDVPIVLQRHLKFGWPLALTFIAAPFVFMAIVMEYILPAVVVAAGLVGIAIFAWIFVIRRTRPLGSVSAQGLRLGAEFFPWDRVGIAASMPGGPDLARDLIVLLLGDPRELRIPLGDLTASPAVVHQVIEAHCRAARDRRARDENDRKLQPLRARLAAHPEQEELIAREVQQEFEREMRDHQMRLGRLNAQLEKASQRTFWSGANGERTTARQWLAIAVVCAVVGLCAFGVKTDFYKSATWSRASLYAALVASVLLSAWAMSALLPKIQPRGRLGIGIVLPFIIGMSTWLLLANAVPDLFTRLAGKPFTVAQEMRLERVQDNGCRLRIYAPMFDTGHITSFYCASSAEFSRLPARGTMRARGQETWFGKHVDVVEPEPIKN